jgi:hypothetical protein
MEREQIRLGTRGQKQALVLNQLLIRMVDLSEVATLLGPSARQLKRLKAGCADGAALVHGDQRSITPAGGFSGVREGSRPPACPGPLRRLQPSASHRDAGGARGAPATSHNRSTDSVQGRSAQYAHAARLAAGIASECPRGHVDAGRRQWAPLRWRQRG